MGRLICDQIKRLITLTYDYIERISVNYFFRPFNVTRKSPILTFYQFSYKTK
jgi:hypothetical protein